MDLPRTELIILSPQYGEGSLKQCGNTGSDTAAEGAGNSWLRRDESSKYRGYPSDNKKSSAVHWPSCRDPGE